MEAGFRAGYLPHQLASLFGWPFNRAGLVGARLPQVFWLSQTSPWGARTDRPDGVGVFEPGLEVADAALASSMRVAGLARFLAVSTNLSRLPWASVLSR